MASLGTLLVPAAIATGTVFSIFAAPLAMHGSQPLTILLKEERVFEGQLREIATPYLAMAGLFSLGAGLTTFAAVGWRRSARQAETAETQLLQAQHQLKQKEAQLQETLLSDDYLTNSGLSAFLDERSSFRSATVTAVPAAPSRPTASPTLAATAPVPQLHAAQAFLGFSRGATQRESVESAESASAIAKMQQLQTQLQQIMTEIETIQSTLRVETANPEASTAPQAPFNHLTQRFQVLDSAWTVQKT